MCDMQESSFGTFLRWICRTYPLMFHNENIGFTEHFKHGTLLSNKQKESGRVVT